MLAVNVLELLGGWHGASGLWHGLGGVVGVFGWAAPDGLGWLATVTPPDAHGAGAALDAAGRAISDAAGAAGGGDGAPHGPTMGRRVLLYGVFSAIVVALLTLDILVFHKRAHTVKIREAVTWTIVWVSLASLFVVPLYFMYESHFFDLGKAVPIMGQPGETKVVSGWEAVGEYFTGYVIELSLSMDNLFVMAVIFGSLKVPKQYQHRVLFWGILGAIIMRGLMIALGVALIKEFDWIVYVFGGFLILTAIKMALTKEEGGDPSLGPITRILSRFFPISERLEGERLFVRIDGKRFATPLFVALVTIEFTDLIFAVDSIPAIFAITADPFIVFTSNIMAILGLRSMYSCLSAMLGTFRFLKPALIVVLLFVGVKMCIMHTPLAIPKEASLLVVLGILATGVIASLLAPHPRQEEESPTAPELPGKRAVDEGERAGWDS